jgi:hypothetical protein
MPVQFKNCYAGNAARRRLGKIRVHNRIWALRDAIAAEIAPPVEDKLEEIQSPRIRYANRRSTDSKGLRGGGGDATFFHPELGKPEVGVRMVSVLKRQEEPEETQNLEVGVEEVTSVNNNLEVNP